MSVGIGLCAAGKLYFPVGREFFGGELEMNQILVLGVDINSEHIGGHQGHTAHIVDCVAAGYCREGCQQAAHNRKDGII